MLCVSIRFVNSMAIMTHRDCNSSGTIFLYDGPTAVGNNFGHARQGHSTIDKSLSYVCLVLMYQPSAHQQFMSTVCARLEMNEQAPVSTFESNIQMLSRMFSTES